MVDNDSGNFRDNVARGGNFLVLTFTKSKSQLRDLDTAMPIRVKSREHWFFKVEAARELRYRPYNAGIAVSNYKEETEGVSDPYLDPEEGIDAVSLVDENGNEILRNDDDEWFAYHVGVAPIHGDVRVYPQVPDSQPGGVFQYLGSNRPDATTGDPIGYVSGDDNPTWYDPESQVSTTFAWDTGVNTDIKYEFYNEHKTRRKIPKLNIFGAGYVLSPIVNKNVQRNLLDAANTNDPSVTHIEYGPIRETFSYDVPDEWDSADNYIEESMPSIPPKFRDTPNSVSVSESRNELDVGTIREGNTVQGSESNIGSQLDGSRIDSMSDRELARAVRGAINNG